jgi:hypothetical protein
MISYEIQSASKPELAYRFSFPYGAPASEILAAVDEVVAGIKTEAERIKAQQEQQAVVTPVEEATNNS